MRQVKQTSLCLCLFGVMSGCFVGVTTSKGSDGLDVRDVLVTVSPSTIVLGCDKGAMVTVHTDIALSVVDRNSVELSGVPAAFTKSDNCGNLVAKFSQEAIEAIVAPPDATLVLTGMTIDGFPFSGADSVRVIEDPAPEE